MFGKLKDKLKNWTKNLSKKAESEETEEEIQEEGTEIQDESKVEETPEKVSKKELREKKRAEKKAAKELKKQEKKKESELEKEIEELAEVTPRPEIEKTETVEELIEPPQKFNVGTESFEPDLEKLEEIEEDFSKNIKKQKGGITSKETPTSDSEEQIGRSPEGAAGGKTPEEKKEKKSFFKKIISGKVKFSDEDFEKYSEDLEILLLENNVALEVADKIVEKIKAGLVGIEFSKKEIESEIQKTFKEVIEEILIPPFNLIEKIKSFRKNSENKNKPYKILFCGINGTGKTTSIAKFAHLLKKNNLSCVFAAGDTFRAASIEQIKKHGENLGINVIAHEYGSDPASVGFDAIKYAEKNNLDVVLIDTAGRMHTEKNLMMQIEKVVKVTQPNTKIFVGESITGNDIVEQVKAFNESVKIDGIILSKADIDEKGGTALSVGYTTGKPILYLGTGQNYEDFEPFDKEKFIEKLGL